MTAVQEKKAVQEKDFSRVFRGDSGRGMPVDFDECFSFEATVTITQWKVTFKKEDTETECEYLVTSARV